MRRLNVNPGWLNDYEGQLSQWLHRSLLESERQVIRSEFLRQRNSLWEDLGQLLIVEILSHPAEAEDIRRAVWRVSKRLT